MPNNIIRSNKISFRIDHQHNSVKIVDGISVVWLLFYTRNGQPKLVVSNKYNIQFNLKKSLAGE